MNDGTSDAVALTNEQIQEIARALGIEEEGARELVARATAGSLLPTDSKGVVEIFKVFSKDKTKSVSGDKVIENVTLINQHERVGRNDPCPNHNEFKFKKCPHGCSRLPRKLVGRVTRKTITD